MSSKRSKETNEAGFVRKVDIYSLLRPRKGRAKEEYSKCHWFPGKGVASTVRRNLMQFALLENREFASFMPFSFAEVSLTNAHDDLHTPRSNGRSRSDSFDSVSSAEEACFKLALKEKPDGENFAGPLLLTKVENDQAEPSKFKADSSQGRRKKQKARGGFNFDVADVLALESP